MVQCLHEAGAHGGAAQHLTMPEDPLSQIQQRLDAMARTLAQLGQRLDALEARMAQAGAAAVPPPPPPWPELQVLEAGEQASAAGLQAGPAETAAPEPPSMQAARAAAASAETSFGLAWLNRIGVVTLVLGAAFLFKYAVDNEWIGPWARVTLGALAGAAALVAAERLFQRGQRVFAAGITALGLGLLYLASYAMHGFYGLAPVHASFLAMAAATAVGAWLALRYGSQAIVVLSLFGGFATPLVLSTGRDAPWALFPYLLLLDAGAVWAARRRQWRAAEALALAASAAMYAAWFLDRFEPAKRAPAAFFTFGAYGLFLLSSSGTVRRLAQWAAGLSAVWLFEGRTALLFAALLPMLGTGLARGMPAAAAASFWLAYWIHASALGPGDAFALRLAGVTAGFVLAGAWIVLQARASVEFRSWAVQAVFATHAAAWYASAFALLDAAHRSWAGAFTFAAAALFALSSRLARPAANLAMLSAILSAALFTLAIPLQFGAWRVSVAWVLEAVLLAFLASRFEARLPHWLAAAVLALALGRAALVDARISVETTFVNPRFFALAWAAAGCWVSACWLRPPMLITASYVAGHAAFLGGIELEVLGWIERTAAPEDVRSASILAFTVVLGLYGLLLVAHGVARNFPVNRIAGLAALVLAIAKLYAWDVWMLGRLFRSTALVALGLLLVAASWVYSRHRERLKKLVQ